MSSSPRSEPGVETSLAALVAACQRERSAYYATSTAHSPACIALFQRAFDGDQAAWAAIYTLFDSQMRAWVGQQQQLEPDDVVQDAWRGFAHTAPQRPTLLATDDLSPLLAYLRTCTKNALLMLLRAARAQRRQPTWLAPAESPETGAGSPGSARLPAGQAVSLDAVADVADQQNIDADVEQRALHASVLARAEALMATEQERLALHCRLKLWLAPREMLTLYPDQFQDIREVRTIVQRITRRLSQDPEICALLER